MTEPPHAAATAWLKALLPSARWKLLDPPAIQALAEAAILVVDRKQTAYAGAMAGRLDPTAPLAPDPELAAALAALTRQMINASDLPFSWADAGSRPDPAPTTAEDRKDGPRAIAGQDQLF